MSITQPDDRVTSYAPVVPTTTFAADFPVFDNDDLAVFVNGVEREDFTVSATYVQSISNDARVVFNPGVTGDVKVVGAREPRRTSRFGAGPINAIVLNAAFDPLVGEMQEARRDIDRSLKVPIGTSPLGIPAPEDNTVVGWDGTQLVNKDPGQFINDAGYATAEQGEKADTAIQPLSLIQTRSSIARGAGISDALWNARINEFEHGERGTSFVWNDPTQDELIAGFNPGQQIWIGDNPTPTPGGGHAVGSTICVANGRGRNALYGQNILVGAANGGPSYTDCFICGMEINVYADFPSTVSDAFSGGNRKNGLELTSQGNTGRVTAAAMIWSADPSGNAWWHQGLAISRCVDTGISFQKAPGGVSDGVNPFNVAAIHDKSDSRSVLKIDGTHESVFDISGVSSPGSFVKGRSGQHTTLLMKNSVNFNFDLVLDSGGSAAQVSSITLSDRGSAKFQIAKSAGNALAIIDMAAGISVMSFDGNTSDAVVIRVGGQDKRVQVGAPDSAGSGFRSLRVSN